MTIQNVAQLVDLVASLTDRNTRGWRNDAAEMLAKLLSVSQQTAHVLASGLKSGDHVVARVVIDRCGITPPIDPYVAFTQAAEFYLARSLGNMSDDDVRSMADEHARVRGLAPANEAKVIVLADRKPG